MRLIFSSSVSCFAAAALSFSSASFFCSVGVSPGDVSLSESVKKTQFFIPADGLSVIIVLPLLSVHRYKSPALAAITREKNRHNVKNTGFISFVTTKLGN